MQNYAEFRDYAGISQATMVNILRPYFPSFTKSICSIVERPWKYGCSLAPEAEAVLIETFGPGPGLARPDNDAPLPAPKRSRANRRKGNRITIWMSDDLYMRLISMKTAAEYPTMQALAEAAIAEFVDRNYGA